MKYFSVFLLFIFILGCSKSGTNLTPVIPTGSAIVLDSQLQGIWNLEDTYYFRSFSSNGKYASWVGTIPGQETIGDYWVEDDYLITNQDDESSFTGPEIYLYNIFDSDSSTILTLNAGNWIKQ